MPRSFDQLPEETSKAYAAFVAYLSLGPERSVGPAAKKCGKAEGSLRKWSERHGWVARARDYDAFLVEQERELQAVAVRSKAVAWAERQEELKEAEWKAAEEAIELCRKLMRDISLKATLGDVAKLLDVASKLARLATGLETDRRELTGKDGGPVQVQVDVAPLIQRVYGGAGRVEIASESTSVIDVQAEEEKVPAAAERAEGTSEGRVAAL